MALLRRQVRIGWIKPLVCYEVVQAEMAKDSSGARFRSGMTGTADGRKASPAYLFVQASWPEELQRDQATMILARKQERQGVLDAMSEPWQG